MPMTQREVDELLEAVKENQLFRLLMLIEKCETAEEVRQIIKALLTTK